MSEWLHMCVCCLLSVQSSGLRTKAELTKRKKSPKYGGVRFLEEATAKAQDVHMSGLSAGLSAGDHNHRENVICGHPPSQK